MLESETSLNVQRTMEDHERRSVAKHCIRTWYELVTTLFIKIKTNQELFITLRRSITK